MTPSKQPRVSIFRPITFLVLSLGWLVCYAVLLVLRAHAGHDQSWYLYGAGQMLQGVECYGPRLTETNPPLILWFSFIPVLIAKALSISGTIALRLVVLAMIGGSVAWCLRIFHRKAYAESVSEGLLRGLGIAGIVLAINFYDFGQREQLMVLLTLPYILAAATDTERTLSAAEYCALGVSAGLGVCLKPQQALVILVLEIFLVLQKRSVRRLIRPEFLMLVITGAAYALAIRLLTPLYLSVMVPELLNTYWAFGRFSALHLALHQQMSFTLVLLAFLIACVVLRKKLLSPMVPVVLAVCSVGASVAFDIQHTAWVYQAFPEKAFFALAVLFMGMDLGYPMLEQSLRRPGPATRVVLALVAVVIAALGSIALHRRSLNAAPPDRAYLEPLLAPYPAQTTVYIFSSSLVSFSDVFEHNFLWGSRFGHLWMLPAIAQNESGFVASHGTDSAPFHQLSPEVLATLESVQRQDVTEDLALWKPVLVLVESCRSSHPCGVIEGKDFDTIAWFLRSPAFASEWSHYRQQPGNTVFAIYTRIP
jgi:hypothetical protein